MTERPTIYRLNNVPFPVAFTMGGNHWLLRVERDDQRSCWTCTLEGPTRWHVGTCPAGSSEDPPFAEGLVVDGRTFLDKVFQHLVASGVAEQGPAPAAAIQAAIPSPGTDQPDSAVPIEDAPSAVSEYPLHGREDRANAA